jgi:ATP-dependent DNA helicase RecG
VTRDIPERESLTVEFKSDRGRLSDRDLIAAVICLANPEGGDLYLGVEDDGTVTGLHPAHRNLTGLMRLLGEHHRGVAPLVVTKYEARLERLMSLLKHDVTIKPRTTVSQANQFLPVA